AVVRLPDPKKKTLGKKESRDAIFDENRFSSMSRPKGIIPNLDESQRDDHSDDVPSEIPEPRKALAAVHNLLIHQMDVKTTFLNGDLDEEALSMKDMGEADVILGIKIKHENKGIVITQSHYIEKILKKFNREDFSSKFNREDCSPVSTTMDPVEKLKPNTSKPVDQLEYSRASGCLMYAMTSTRSDIAYAVGKLSRFTSNPSRQHWKAITRVFKYLRGTMNYGLSYVGYPSVLEAYSDASWINHVEDSSSTSGWVFLLGGGAISWASKKQTCITSSTIESEFVAWLLLGMTKLNHLCEHEVLPLQEA
nr:zinc finger, CCHC-type [Tanacetum cinerariifolium]